MSTDTYTRYEDYMAALGWPEHHVMVGPDWWGCLCGTLQAPMPHTVAMVHAGAHIGATDAEAVSVEWSWSDVQDWPDLHQSLWESEAF